MLSLQVSAAQSQSFEEVDRNCVLAVKKLLNRSGVNNVNVRDNSGRSALLYALGPKSNEHSYYVDYKTHAFHQRWTAWFQTSAVLLSSGASTANCDDCTCHCLYRGIEHDIDGGGCTLFNELLCPIYSSMNRAQNLAAIPWLLEVFELIESLGASGDLRYLLMALFQRQAFDELGMTHTCCLAKRGLFNPGFGNPGGAAMDDELKLSRAGVTRPSTMGDEDDADDIGSEQSELAEHLIAEVNRFDGSLDDRFSGKTLDIEWIKVLARRAVFIECGMAKAAAIDEEKHKEESSHSVRTRQDDMVSLLPIHQQNKKLTRHFLPARTRRDH